MFVKSNKIKINNVLSTTTGFFFYRRKRVWLNAILAITFFFFNTFVLRLIFSSDLFEHFSVLTPMFRFKN